ncbi:MAG: dienelactone hydrolase family protein [Candidatus Thermoplasmatota archaeon]|nr:dienelactone hydrolase family protein [Candidatus Thermoplasmatota archaeon]
MKTKMFLVTAIMGLMLATALSGCTSGNDITTEEANVQNSTPPDGHGPYYVGYYYTTYYDLSWGPYHATVRYPAQSDGLYAPNIISDKPYPGIIVSGGLADACETIAWVAEHLTSHGYVTLTFTIPNPASLDDAQWACGFDGGIRQLKSENESPSSPIQGILDIERFGVIGLSSGGGGVMQATSTNPEIDAAVALSPDPPEEVAVDASRINVPIQIQVGSNDDFNNASSVYEYYAPIPDAATKEYVEINGGSHTGYVGPGYAGIPEGWGAHLLTSTVGYDVCTIGVEEQQRIARKYFTAWFGYFIKDIHEYKTYIFGDDAQKDLDGKVLSALEYNYTEGHFASNAG